MDIIELIFIATIFSSLGLLGYFHLVAFFLNKYHEKRIYKNRKPAKWKPDYSSLIKNSVVKTNTLINLPKEDDLNDLVEFKVKTEDNNQDLYDLGSFEIVEEVNLKVKVEEKRYPF